jgi:transcriptional regulator with XRE-family HTH domain
MSVVAEQTLRLEPKPDRRVNVGAVVRALRERKGWRQTDLANAAGVAPNTVGGLEAGRRTLRPNVAKIARALGTTLDALDRGEIPDPVAGLDVEDLAIAYAAAAAPPSVRSLVRALLFHASDLSVRIAHLDSKDRDAITVAIEAAEERRRAATKSRKA